jgi:hypothetical protein
MVEKVEKGRKEKEFVCHCPLVIASRPGCMSDQPGLRRFTPQMRPNSEL